MKAKDIIKMDYGTSGQMSAADSWWKRFTDFAEKHPDMFIGETHISDLRRKILFIDIFYQAQRRLINH